MFEEEFQPQPMRVALGDSLAGLSIAELEERVGALRAEIERVENELTSKRAGLAAAEAVFGKA